MTPFFYAGFDTIPQQAEEAAEGLDWRKISGVIISMALLAAGGFYVMASAGFGSFIPGRTSSPITSLHSPFSASSGWGCSASS